MFIYVYRLRKNRSRYSCHYVTATFKSLHKCNGYRSSRFRPRCVSVIADLHSALTDGLERSIRHSLEVPQAASLLPTVFTSSVTNRRLRLSLICGGAEYVKVSYFTNGVDRTLIIGQDYKVVLGVYVAIKFS